MRLTFRLDVKLAVSDCKNDCMTDPQINKKTDCQKDHEANIKTVRETYIGNKCEIYCQTDN